MSTKPTIAALIGASCLAPLLLAASCIGPSDQEREMLMLALTDIREDLPGIVTAKGQWRLIAGEEKPPAILMPEINLASVVCDRGGGFCYEFVALVWSREERDPCPCADTEDNYFRITSWDDGTIRAVAEYPAVDLELVVSVTDRTVERTWRETNARGVATSNPPAFLRWGF